MAIGERLLIDPVSEGSIVKLGDVDEFLKAGSPTGHSRIRVAGIPHPTPFS
jgi:hypothetical protein